MRKFARAIGLLADKEPWHITFRNRVTDILNLVAAVGKQAGDKRLPFHRIVNAATGKPGQGFTHETKISVT